MHPHLVSAQEMPGGPAMIPESIGDAFFCLDRHWEFTYVNRQAEKLLGRSSKDLLGKSVWDLYPGLAGSESGAAYRRSAGEQAGVSLTSCHPDQQRRHEAHVYPAAHGISACFRDVA